LTTRLLPNYTWIKFPIACLEDRDFMGLDNAAAGIYVKLYLLAARSDSEGLLCNGREAFSLEYMAWHLRIDPGALEAAIHALTETGFMTIDQEGYWITRFMQEQGPGDSLQREKWAARQRKSRARIKEGEKPDSQVEREIEEEQE
jgi:hypothetical protein